jgi:hypothetical protein
MIGLSGFGRIDATGSDIASGIVDQDVDPAEALMDLRDQCLGNGRLSQIATDMQGVDPMIRGNFSGNRSQGFAGTR